MSIDKRRNPCNDLNHRIAAGLANDFTVEKLAEFTATSPTTVKRYKNDESVQRLENIIRAANAQNERRVAEEAAEDAKTKISRILSKALRASERVVEEALKTGDFTQLLAAHKVGEFAAKFELSEAPKRLSVEGNHVHEHRHVIGLAEAENIIRTRQILTAARPLIAGDQEPIDVESVAQ